jgi:putative hydrolase
VIPSLITLSRKLGAKLVVVHGETIVEPVASGTNRMAIEASADILAHPGLITEEEVLLARKQAVYLEVTSRKGHSLTNGHVARLARAKGAAMILNSDAHAPGDIWPAARLPEVALGAGLTEADYKGMMANAERMVERCLNSKI